MALVPTLLGSSGGDADDLLGSLLTACTTPTSAASTIASSTSSSAASGFLFGVSDADLALIFSPPTLTVAPQPPLAPQQATPSPDAASPVSPWVLPFGREFDDAELLGVYALAAPDSKLAPAAVPSRSASCFSSRSVSPVSSHLGGGALLLSDAEEDVLDSLNVDALVPSMSPPMLATRMTTRRASLALIAAAAAAVDPLGASPVAAQLPAAAAGGPRPSVKLTDLALAELEKFQRANWWTDELLSMSASELNRYVKLHNFSEQDIAALKAARRRSKNRVYSAHARQRRKVREQQHIQQLRQEAHPAAAPAPDRRVPLLF